MAGRVTTEKVRGMLAALERRYGGRRRPPPVDVLGQIMEVLLRSMAGERAARMVLKELKKEFVDWNEIRVASRSEIMRITEDIDDGAAVSDRIQAFLKSIYEERGNLNLDNMPSASPGEVRQFLKSLSPLGRDLVPVIMLLAMQQNVMPVGDRILRLHKRFKIVPRTATQTQLRRTIESVFEGDELYRYYIVVRRLAERLCLGENPNCRACTVNRDCRVSAQPLEKR